MKRTFFCLILLLVSVPGLQAGVNAWNGWNMDRFDTIVAGDPDEPNLVYAGNANGFYKSYTNGSGWVTATFGLTDKHVNCLLMHPRDPRTLFAGTESGGVFRSSDQGDSWTAVNTGMSGLTVYAMSSIVRSLPPPEVVSILVCTNNALYVSTNNGDSWTSLGDFETVAAAQGTIGTVYAATANICKTSGGCAEIKRSHNTGASWTSVLSALGAVSGLAAFVPSGSTTPYVYAAIPGTGIYRSTNDGDTWSLANTGLPDLSAKYLALVDEKTVFASSGGWIYRTTDAGNSWVNASSPLSTVSAIAVHADWPDRVFASGVHGEFTDMFDTNDYTRTWSHFAWSDPTGDDCFATDGNFLTMTAQGGQDVWNCERRTAPFLAWAFPVTAWYVTAGYWMGARQVDTTAGLLAWDGLSSNPVHELYAGPDALTSLQLVGSVPESCAFVGGFSGSEAQGYLKMTREWSTALGKWQYRSFFRDTPADAWASTGTVNSSEALSNVGFMAKSWGTGDVNIEFYEPHFLAPDVDGDNTFSSADLTALQSILAGTTAEGPADVNLDGARTALDLTILINVLAGKM